MNKIDPIIKEKLLIAKNTITNLLLNINEIENNKLSVKENMVKIKKIKEELTKVHQEVDILKKRLILSNHKIN